MRASNLLLIVWVAAVVCSGEAFDLTSIIKDVGKGISSAISSVGNGFKDVEKTVTSVGKELRKTACKALFAIGCPVALKAAGKAIGSLLDVHKDLVNTGVALGTNACHVRVGKCKRSVSNIQILLPFSDEFRDYDKDGDKFITYEEFVSAVMRYVGLADPEELMEPFMFADANGDSKIDTDEFQGAPFLFAHLYHQKQSIDKNSILVEQ